jgi:hypothetical protein
MEKRIKGKIKENKGKDKTGNWIKRKTEKQKVSESVSPFSLLPIPFRHLSSSPFSLILLAADHLQLRTL